MIDQQIAEALTDQRLRACCDAYVQATTLHRTLAALYDAVAAQYDEEEARGAAWSIIIQARQFLAMHDTAARPRDRQRGGDGREREPARRAVKHDDRKPRQFEEAKR